MNTKLSIFERLRTNTKRTVTAPPASPVDIWSNVSSGSLYDWYDRKTMHSLLTRDWFIDEEGIQEVLDCADQDAWEWIYANRNKYSTRIRMLIEPDDYRIPLDNLKIRVVELTDSMMEKIQSERKKAVEEAFENDWIEHSKSIQDRGFGDVDWNLDFAWDNFRRAKDRLANYIENPNPKKYVAPSSRGNTVVDSRQVELENTVREMENEYDVAQKAVDEVDTLYWDIKKNDYRKTWVPTL